MKKTLTLILLLAGLTLDAQGDTLTWDGSEGRMEWNTTDDNWLLGDAAFQYKNGSDVVFGDNGSGEVTLAGELKPASVLVEAENEYIFSGKGKLSGSMQLTKSGSGTLTINTANGYSGGTVIKEGTIVMGNDEALGTGDVTLGAKLLSASLELGGNTLSADVTVAEDTMGGALVQIGNGTLNGDISLGYYSALTLSGYLSGTGDVIMGKCSTLDLNGTALYRNVTLNWDASTGNGFAAIGYGTLNGNITVGAKQVLTVLGELSGTGTIFLGDSCSVAVNLLATSIISKDVNLTGNASISSCTINGKVTVAADKCLTLHGSIDITNEIALGEGSSLDLGNQTMTLQGASSITFSGLSASIGNGTLNGSISVGENKTLTLSGDLFGSGSITLEDNAMLALNENTLSHDVTLTGDAEIGTGTIKGTISVATGKKLTLLGKLDGEGSISLGDQSSLDLLLSSVLTKDVSLTGDANIGSGTINSSITVGEEKTLTLIGNLDGTGSISLGDKATLDLGGRTLSNSVSLAGNSAKIGNGTLNSALSVGKEKTLTLIGDLSGTGSISLGDNATLDLGGYTLSNSVSLAGNSANIGNGKLNSDLSVGGSKLLTLIGNLSGTGSIFLGDYATLDLNNHTISNPIILQGTRSFIGNGTLNNQVTMSNSTILELVGDLTCKHKILVDSGTAIADLDLGGYTLNSDITICYNMKTQGFVDIGRGTLNGDVRVMPNMTVRMHSDLSGTGTITLDNSSLSMEIGASGQVMNRDLVVNSSCGMHEGTLNGKVVLADDACLVLDNVEGINGAISLGNCAKLELGSCSLSPTSVTLDGSATIGNGVLNSKIVVKSGMTLTLSGDLHGTDSIYLGDYARLVLDTHTLSKGVTLTGSSAYIGNGTFNGSLSVANGQSLTLSGDLDGTGSISLGYDTTLYMENHILSNSVTLTGNAGIGGGTFNGSLEVGADNTLSLLGELYGKGKISLGNNAVLELSGSTLSNSVSLAGDSAQIGSGTFNGSLEVGANKKLTLIGYLGGEGKISLGDNATLDLDDQPLSGNVTLTGSNATISNGTVNGTLTAKQGGSAQLSNATIKAGATTVKALAGAERSLLQEISVSAGQITGTDRQTSLADGLYIESEADLLIESMTLTANNEIHVGEHTITLNQVTIDLSQAEYELVGSDYYFQLQDLINCKLEMDDVVFDASALKLPTGFDPGANGIGMDFGDDVTINEQTARNLTLLMGGNWSQSMSLDEQGKVVFKNLVETPEPATGTLGLLALAALAARRRRK